ncbi:hypothetical protein D3C80_1106250 [compost metagenome]
MALGHGQLRALHALGGLDRVDLLLEALDVSLGLAHRLAQTRHAGGEAFGLSAVGSQFGLQRGDLLRHLAGQRLVVGGQRLERVLLVLGDLGLALAHPLGGELLLGHDLRQRFTRLAQFLIGVADFLVEDAQRLTVRQRLAHFVGAAAQGGQQFAPDVHARFSSTLGIRKPS